jgi:uncharacterized protein YeeX (DUF496 family)
MIRISRWMSFGDQTSLGVARKQGESTLSSPPLTSRRFRILAVVLLAGGGVAALATGDYLAKYSSLSMSAIYAIFAAIIVAAIVLAAVFYSFAYVLDLLLDLRAQTAVLAETPPLPVAQRVSSIEVPLSLATPLIEPSVLIDPSVDEHADDTTLPPCVCAEDATSSDPRQSGERLDEVMTSLTGLLEDKLDSIISVVSSRVEQEERRDVERRLRDENKRLAELELRHRQLRAETRDRQSAQLVAELAACDLEERIRDHTAACRAAAESCDPSNRERVLAWCEFSLPSTEPAVTTVPGDWMQGD